jgi:hypothetical protein
MSITLCPYISEYAAVNFVGQGQSLPARARGKCHQLFLVAAFVVGLDGCGRGDRPDTQSGPQPMARHAFDSAYVLVDTIPLAQNDSAPLVRVSGMDLDDHGRIAIADVSEGNVKIYARSGRLLRIIGRKGDGPGEFSQPRYPRFTSDGGLYVGDGQLGRVTRFDSAGTLVRVISYSVIPTMGFELTPNGVALTGAGDSARALMFGDTVGGSSTWLLELSRLRPRDQPDNPNWEYLSQYWLGVDRDSAYVATTLSDSIWSVPLGGTTIRSYRLNVPGYLAPHAVVQVPKGPRGVMEWQKSFHIAAKVIANHDLLAIPFVEGVLTYGDPMILALRPRGRPWVALTGGPPILDARADTLIALLHPGEDPPTLGLYVPQELP